MQRVKKVKKGKCSNKADKKRVVKKSRLVVSTDIIPDKINFTVGVDYDIHSIHQIIISKIEKEKENITNLETELQTELEKVKKPQYANDRKESINKIRKIREEISNIQSGEKLERYLSISNPLILKFGVNDMQSRPDKNIPIIDNFLFLAKNYINIDINKEDNSEEKTCRGCGSNIETHYYVNEVGMYICSLCGTEKQYKALNNYITDGSTSQSSELENLTNYMRTLDRLQGLQNIIIPNKIYEDLDNYYKSIGNPVGSEIRARPLNSLGRKDGTNHKMLHIALEKTGYSDFYEDTNLIAHYYWGWELPDYSAYKCILINRYRTMQPVFDNMKDKVRTSNIGTQYRSFKDLEGVGAPVTHDEFKLPEDISEVERIYKRMCEECGDPDIVFIPTIL